MAHALSSNLALNLPTSRYLLHSRPTQLKPARFMVMGDAREKLDHIPKPNKNHHPLPKKKAAPAAPIAGLWDRFPTARTMQEMMETMERMMEDPFAFSTLEWPSSPLPSEGVGGYRRRGRAPWEVKEGESEYKMRFDMPGMNKEDVKVWVEEKMLVVKAEKAPKKKEMVQQDQRPRQPEEEEEEGWSAKSYGRYSSRIALPDNVQFENIKAEVKDGVLYIAIPKANTSYSNILDIQVQ
ncbi:small heat shock protein, chloroplastic isoform X1 [Vigna radiata var. radiata]|uniref:Small heat shock protein, chloroplastic isoform X1 n=1 Tax=Vigna radiata var. radiata TaxID=3916 RepID=A0A1S3TGZ5_VIGRR|nr:small heat shock protein, chloroplastic isoform X1 [Vigna radiata var. radiata]